MRSIVAFIAASALIVSPCSVSFAQATTGTVQGTARDGNRQPLGDTMIRLRSADTGQLVGQSTSNAAGEFTFAGIQPGNFIVEIVDAAGNILGTATVTVAAGGTATVAVTATAAGVAAAAAGGGGLAALFSGTSLLVITAAAAAGIVIAIVATRKDASPSR